MKDLHFGDFVWLRGQGWKYLGMDEDGIIHLCRPLEKSCFNIIEFEQVYAEELDEFFKSNGESMREWSERKAIRP